MKNRFKISEEEITWLTASEVKKMLNCSEVTLINIRESGKLLSYQINGTLFYKKSDAQKLLGSYKETVNNI